MVIQHPNGFVSGSEPSTTVAADTLSVDGRAPGGPPPAAVTGRTPHRPGRRRRFEHVRHFLEGSWLHRQVVGTMLNALIALVLLVALQHSFGWDTGAWVDFGLLKLFSIWALAFLPSWMFVRFLGKRATALWFDFVLALHRLGVDEPQFLPEPPRTSEYHRAWVAGGGAELAGTPTIYQAKFDVYYGKAASRHVDGTTNVGAETVFPVCLATTVLAVGWTAVLWDTSFAATPTDVFDMMKFGFLGTYAFVVQMLVRRFFQSDLKASAYISSVLRVFVVAILVAVLHQIGVLRDNPQAEAVVAFVVGFFPMVGMQALQGVATTVLHRPVPSLDSPYPLSQIDGLNVWYEARLLEEGIEDMQNLATANVVDVVLHTHVPVGRLVDWIDQAHLYQHLDRLEGTSIERRRARRAARKAGDDADADQRTVTVREGAVARHALRTLGIRTATDLLTVLPERHRTPHDAAWMEASGLDAHRVSSLAQLLAREPGLNVVWNWRSGAAAVRRRDPRVPQRVPDPPIS
jgi:hypothetical protein